ncbi:tryptophan synthase subunit alpha [Virgibacillus siamensis]|uniref:tryptophan synthase subunit alpha n=1 Tax=Virgibacillus siamensis TaxID=480071 RepID=UPI0009842CC5|nr:tryptophan synthase subunit alpha [Virgibacillus siamensis]
MSNLKLDKALKEKLQNNKKLIVPYIMAGDRPLGQLEEQLNFLQNSGAAAVELGIPFSDPVADGPTIQDAGQRSLEQGTTLSSVLTKLKSFKEERTIPVILMTYLNPVFTYGAGNFARDCADAGVNGVIIPDLPLEEEAIVKDDLQENAISYIRLAAMTSPDERLQKIAERTEGFLYAVAVTGTTGARTTHDSNVKNYLQKLKNYTDKPVLAGFGVSTSSQAHELAEACDGVVIGSTIVNFLHEGKTENVQQLLEESV